LLATAACGVGDSSGISGGSDDRNTKLGVTCNGAFKLTGTFTPGTPARPIDPDTNLPLTGCWPVGTWTFTAAVDPAGTNCKSAVEVLPSYSFRLDRAEGTDMQGLTDTVTNLTSIGDKLWHLSVSSNGQGCEGNFEFASADGKDYWDMKPALLNPPNATDPPSTKLVGNGDYDEYTANGWPWK
jgi:hypothetical protein